MLAARLSSKSISFFGDGFLCLSGLVSARMTFQINKTAYRKRYHYQYDYDF